MDAPTARQLIGAFLFQTEKTFSKSLNRNRLKPSSLSVLLKCPRYKSTCARFARARPHSCGRARDKRTLKEQKAKNWLAKGPVIFATVTTVKQPSQWQPPKTPLRRRMRRQRPYGLITGRINPFPLRSITGDFAAHNAAGLTQQ